MDFDVNPSEHDKPMKDIDYLEKFDLGNNLVNLGKFDHGLTAKISHPELKPDFIIPGEEVGIGFDFNRTPDGSWELIEMSPREFGAKGFKEAYQFGDIRPELEGTRKDGFNDFRHIVPTTQDINTELLNKRKASNLLPSAPDQKSIREYEPRKTNIVYVKHPSYDGGLGVEPVRAEEFENKDNLRVARGLGFDDLDELVVEENIPSEGVMVQGEKYDACMRYAVKAKFEEGEMNLEFLGGYWRTAPKPVNSDAPLEQTHISNFANGMAVQATMEELRQASVKAAEVSKEYFSLVMQKFAEDQMTTSHADRYLPDVEILWNERDLSRPYIGEEIEDPEMYNHQLSEMYNVDKEFYQEFV